MPPVLQPVSEAPPSNHSPRSGSFSLNHIGKDAHCGYQDISNTPNVQPNGLLICCDEDLPSHTLALSPRQSPVLDDLSPREDHFLDSSQTRVIQGTPNSDSLLNFAKRPRPQNQIAFPSSGCACACSALEAVTATATASAFAAAAAAAAEAAQVAAAKFRKCCGGNCRCPPAACHCPQTAVPAGTYLCQTSEIVDCTHITTLARSLTAALAAATSRAPCSNSALGTDKPKSPNDVSTPKSCCHKMHKVPSNSQVVVDRKPVIAETDTNERSAVPTSKPSHPVATSTSCNGSSSIHKESLSASVPLLVSPRANYRSKQAERDRPFVCSKCSATFLFKQNRDRHVVEVHLGHRPHKCPYPKCEAAFKNLSGLKQHQKTVHEKARPFKCEKCDSAFGQRNHLRQHVLVVHDKVKMFHCEICGMSFSNVGNRTQHMKRRHSEAAAVRTLSRSQQYHQQQRLQRRHQEQPLQMLSNANHVGRLQEEISFAENTNATSSSSPGMDTDGPVENSTTDCRFNRGEK